MNHIKEIISIITAMNYYSGSNDVLDDHSSASCLQFAVQNIERCSSTESSKDIYLDKLHQEELPTKSLAPKMNNSYPSK